MMKSKVYWTISPLINTPSVIYDNPIKPRTLDPCPVVNDHAQRTRIIPTPYDLKIKPNWFYNQVTEKYIFDGFDTSSKDLKNDHMWTLDTILDTAKETWYDQEKAQFQIVVPYVFISEEDIDMTLTGLQSAETNSDLNNLMFIEATLPIGKMARPLSSAWAFNSNELAHFKKGQPLFKITFSKPVDLYYFTAGELFKSYCKLNNGLVNYQSGTKRRFDNILNRKPKRLFKEIKSNVVYQEV